MHGYRSTFPPWPTSPMQKPQILEVLNLLPVCGTYVRGWLVINRKYEYYIRPTRRPTYSCSCRMWYGCARTCVTYGTPDLQHGSMIQTKDVPMLMRNLVTSAYYYAYTILTLLHLIHYSHFSLSISTSTRVITVHAGRNLVLAAHVIGVTWY
jgi:hypothetical protein